MVFFPFGSCNSFSLSFYSFIKWTVSCFDSDLVVDRYFLRNHIESLLRAWKKLGNRKCFTYGSVINTSNFNNPNSDVLKKALLDGTIDYVTSMHEPIDIDNKKVEFDNALSGSIGLECMFGALSNIFPLDKTIDILTRRKNNLSISQNKIQVGSKAELTLFDPDSTYTFKEDHILSTSKNCAFIGEKMTGKVYGVVNNNNLFENKIWT